jgi:hypothetical protein
MIIEGPAGFISGSGMSMGAGADPVFLIFA